ncbi:hypothetical protein BHE74_00012100 [Ensete ventricosum]|nr:hypothetical protein BHE74_00012100 [Ensete ventricosum]
MFNCLLELFVQTNLIKESIRMGFNDLADFFYAHGQLGDAFKNYVRTRDYCTTSKHIIHMCLNVILVSIELSQFMHVSNYVSKAEQTPEQLDPVTHSKLRCAAGLAHLETKKYKLAARKVFGLDQVQLGFGREKLCKIIFQNSSFGFDIFYAHSESKFHCSRYASCLEYLENLKPNLLLDIHLHDHVETLYTEIRHKAIIQYTIPFISVDLHTMAGAFKTNVAGLEKELEALITDNQIQVSAKATLAVTHPRQRTTKDLGSRSNGGRSRCHLPSNQRVGRAASSTVSCSREARSAEQGVAARSATGTADTPAEEKADAGLSRYFT